jgi:hypothetical protein
MSNDNPLAEFKPTVSLAEFEKPQSDRAWKLIAGRWSTEQQMEDGNKISWRNAEWVIYSDEEPEFELVEVPGGDGQVDSIRIEALPYEVEMLSMYGGDLHGLDEEDIEESIVDWTYVWNFRVEEMA